MHIFMGSSTVSIERTTERVDIGNSTYKGMNDKPHHVPHEGSSVPRDVFLELRQQASTRRWVLLILVVGTPSYFVILGFVLSGSTSARRLQAALTPVGLIFLVIEILAAYYLLVPVRWDCPGCKRRLNNRVRWRCSACGATCFKFSFLHRCGNFDCLAVPKAYECPHEDCHALTYLTPERDSTHPARKVKAAEGAPPSDDEVKAKQAKRIENYEFEVKELNLLIEIDRLRLRRNPTHPPDERQARINGYMRQMDAIVDECRTVAQSTTRQRACHVEIDAMGIPESDKKNLKELADKLFERFRLQSGGDVPME